MFSNLFQITFRVIHGVFDVQDYEFRYIKFNNLFVINSYHDAC